MDHPCHYCGINTVVTDQRIPTQRSVDHVIPRSRGGKNTKDNRVTCCIACNTSKGGRTVEEWRRALAKKQIGQVWFSAVQIEWLNRNGFEWPALPEIEFYFEKWDRPE